jgi:hypothetical protein
MANRIACFEQAQVLNNETRDAYLVEPGWFGTSDRTSRLLV